MRRALILVFALLAASTLNVTPSRAQFAECNHDYVRTFDVPAYGDDPAWSAGTIECVEYFRFEFSTPGGQRWIRGIGDVNVDRLLAPGAIAAVREGARLAAQRMDALGDYRIDNTTILMTFSVSEPLSTERKEGQSAAWTMPGQGVETSECHVTMFLMDDYNTTGEMQYITAHELFHCVQKASLSEAQNASAAAYGLWWIEGSAELFAAAAIGEQARWNNASSFDDAVRNERPLYAMTYEAAVFFYWRNQQSDLGGLMPFLRRMAGDPSEGAQRGAIRAAVSDSELLDFAQAYDERTIRFPSGRPLPFGARIDGETWNVTATGTQRRTLKPFVIMPGITAYACANWDNRVSDANLRVRDESGGAWGDWPAQTNARDSGGARYRSIAFHSGDENVELTLRHNRTAACGSCLEVAAIDRCLVGRWQLTGGGPGEWLQRQGIPFTRMNITPMMLTMGEDGVFTTGGFSSDFRADYGDMAGEGRASTAPTNGRWGAQGGRLYGCTDSGGASSGTATVESSRGRGTAPYSSPGLFGVSGSTTYSCNDTTFSTEQPMERGGPMTHTFTRQTPRLPE
jgi:hypothetical protein